VTAADRDARARRVARQYRSGRSARQIARLYRMHPQTVLGDLNRLDPDSPSLETYRERADRLGRVPERDKRMETAVRLSAQGKSLREIAKELGAKSPQTIANDLKRWHEAHPNAVPLRELSKSVVQNTVTGGRNETTEMDSPLAAVISLKRKAAT
jgi:DNA-binding CsgD family transcriptional regulator